MKPLGNVLPSASRKVICFLVVGLVFAEVGVSLGTIIPPDRMVPWVPGVTVGMRGSIPVRTNLLDITRYGATTNNGSVTGTIAAGSTALQVSSVGDFAKGHGVWVSNIYNTVITNIVGNTFYLRDAAPSAVSGTLVKHDNAPVINAVIQSAQRDDVVYIPGGTFVTRSPVSLMYKSYVTLRGASNSLIACVAQGGGSALGVGVTQLLPSQAKQFAVTNAVLKGSSQFSLTSPVYAPFNDSIRAGEMYTLSTLNGNDPNFRAMSVYGFERVLQQTIYIENVAGNVVTFSPPAVWNFTNQPYIVQVSIGPAHSVGIENVSITQTNAGEQASPYGVINTVALQSMVDSWVTNCTFSYANNYNLYVTGCSFCNFDANTFRFMMSSGTSHAGLILEQCSGCLVQNNIFDSLDFGMQLWGASTMGCAFFANFWTNTTHQAIIFHNTHHMMNLFEENVADMALEIDGYYGSNSHETLLRNRILGAVSLKRFTTYINAVGNIIGSPKYNYYYDSQTLTGDWPIFETGNPNIGNTSYSGTAPPMGWNYPQTSFYGNHGTGVYVNRAYTNCSYKFTQTLVNTTNLTGNFSAWPYSAQGGYALIFQDGVNTNLYHKLADTLPGPADQASRYQYAAQPPTTSGMKLSYPMTISNGWTMLVGSPDTYQQLQTADVATDIRHGNCVYTNYIPILVWDPTIADTSIATSLLYTNGPPAWWGTNRWPAVDPVFSSVAAPIPAQLRYLGISSGSGGTKQPPGAPTGLHVSGSNY